MITYELAKKLKDAGFPQDLTGEWVGRHDADDKGENKVLIPTLSELIEECDKLNGLGQIGRAVGGWNVWRLGVSYPTSFGLSIEGAVANLYLALKVKS